MIESEVLLTMFGLGILEGYLMKVVINHIKRSKIEKPYHIHNNHKTQNLNDSIPLSNLKTFNIDQKLISQVSIDDY